mmetsp:Transcript_5968/g.22574  ORF Transcript_5968/g.22574 Transcript_5968/m.22574 type:complete len:243 (-) Transcript_5968:7-735(-)
MKNASPNRRRWCVCITVALYAPPRTASRPCLLCFSNINLSTIAFRTRKASASVRFPSGPFFSLLLNSSNQYSASSPTRGGYFAVQTQSPSLCASRRARKFDKSESPRSEKNVPTKNFPSCNRAMYKRVSLPSFFARFAPRAVGYAVGTGPPVRGRPVGEFTRRVASGRSVPRRVSNVDSRENTEPPDQAPFALRIRRSSAFSLAESIRACWTNSATPGSADDSRRAPKRSAPVAPAMTRVSV